jgi:hypothetical protein
LSKNNGDVLLYWVEGETERALIMSLKKRYIKSGKISVFNIVEKQVGRGDIRTLKHGTTLILIFDTDTGDFSKLNENLKILVKEKAIKKIVLIPQNKNLEDELVRATNIIHIRELLGSQSNSDFKYDCIHCNNFFEKIENKEFDINSLWKQDNNLIKLDFDLIKNQKIEIGADNIKINSFNKNNKQ